MSKLHELNRMGQSPWLNYMRRSFIESGELRLRMNDGIRGITANATIFQRALMASNDYDELLQAQLAAGMPTRRIHEALMVDDVQRTADMLHPIFESSGGLDGLASLELDPGPHPRHCRHSCHRSPCDGHAGSRQCDGGNSVYSGRY